jgi:hypothetical protein
MKPDTIKNIALVIGIIAVFCGCIYLTGGKCGPSDLDLYKMAAEPYEN